MRILALIDRQYEKVTRRTLGECDLLTSPPIRAGDLKTHWFEEADIIYIDLFGEAGDEWMYSTRGRLLSLDFVRSLALSGPIVFATTCFLPDTEFAQAFLDAGARAVIGGGELNWVGARRMAGAQWLAFWFVRSLRAGKSIEKAFKRARGKLWLRKLWSKAAADAVQFRLYT